MSLLHEWDAEQVSNKDVAKFLAEGWEPIGMAQMTVFDGMGRPAGAAVFWAMRRRRPRVNLALLEPKVGDPVSDKGEG